MTADELMDLLTDAATQVGIREFTAFRARVAHDLSLVREVAQSPSVVRTEAEERRGREAIKPRQPFKSPPQYSDQLESWIVFSAFVNTFIDPIAWAVEAGTAFGSFTADEGINVVTCSTDLEPTNEEFELLDVDRLNRDLKELIALARILGREALGSRFSMSDFLGEEERPDDRH